MSKLSGDGRSISSGNNTGGEGLQRQQQLHQDKNPYHGSNSESASTAAATINSNASTTKLQQKKKKRNLPGTPDPTAVVITLSPTTLMATNRFVCEICNKGFQRDQNLQLHRRRHNLPCKLRQRTSTEIRKRVYVCPETTCVHHSPYRALGDLTGIKKHFCRKHGERKWKCDKCSKKYAVQSDWKAHSKTCGTREYKCDCGTIFSRRDSFITHRAFCDALSEENNKAKQDMTTQTSNMARNLQDQVLGDVSSSNIPATNNNTIGFMPNLAEETKITPLRPISRNELVMLPNPLKSLGMVLAGAMFPNGPASLLTPSLQLGGGTATASFTDHNSNIAREAAIIGPSSSSAHTSATALLLKAAQMGATASNSNIAPPMMHRSFIPGMGVYGNNSRSIDQLHAGPFGCHGVSHANSSEAVVLDGFSEPTFFDAPVYDSWPMMMENLELASDVSGNRSSSSLVMGRNMGMDGLVTRPGDGRATVQSRISGAGDVTTVDFLGIGGTSSLGLNEQQERGMDHLDSLQFSGAGGAILEKPLWDV